MSTLSASPVEPGPAAAVPPAGSAAARGALVWDAPVRIGHWLMVISFAGAWLTAESERWRLVHVSLGYTLAGLVVFRVLWGLFGTRHARFASFVRGPGAVAAYLRSLLSAQPQHHSGHNPAGALAIVGLLGLGAALTASGWATYNELGGEWLEEAHEWVANAMLALVGVHVLGVVVSSRLHRENLVKAMVTGRKPVPAADGIRRAWWPLGVAVLAAVLGFWAWQFSQAPVSGTGDPPTASESMSGGTGLTSGDGRGGRANRAADQRRKHHDKDDD